MTPKPTTEEIAEAKAIMKGTKELSKDKDKRARQKELIKLMSAKRSADDAGPSSSRSVDPSASSSSSRKLDPSAPSSPAKPPTPEELAEVKAIMKGKAEMSTDKDKRARQKELIKMIMAKQSGGDPTAIGAGSSAPVSSTKPPTADELTELQDILSGKAELSDDKTKRARQKELIKMVTGGGGGKDEPSAKKGVSFADEPLGPTGSGDPGKPSSSSRSGPSSSAKPESGSRSSSSRDPSVGVPSAGGDPSIPGPRRSSGPDDGPNEQNE
jgi:hypothetical protein